MKQLTLHPKQIITGEDGLSDLNLLQVYHRICERGHYSDFPPILVVDAYTHSIDVLLQEKREEERAGIKRHLEDLRCALDSGAIVPIYDIERSKEEIRSKYAQTLETYRELMNRLQELTSRGATYLLVDGNHRSTAVALTGSHISALELQTDADILAIRNLVAEGMLFNFNRNEKTVKELVLHWYECYNDFVNDVKTVPERVQKLISDGDLPHYMIKDKLEIR